MGKELPVKIYKCPKCLKNYADRGQGMCCYCNTKLIRSGTIKA